jgi:hypothetical protein
MQFHPESLIFHVKFAFSKYLNVSTVLDSNIERAAASFELRAIHHKTRDITP